MEEIKLKITNPEKHFNEVNQINHNLSAEQKEKLQKAAIDFESIFTSMMLKSMMNTTEGGLFGSDGYGSDIMDGIFESKLADYMSYSNSLGIAGMIYRKMTGEELNPENPIKRISNFSLPIKLNFNELPVISPSSSSLNRLQKFDEIISKAASTFNLNENIVRSIILAESAGNEFAISKANAKGLMQLIDSTANEMGVRNVWNPEENIFGGTKYFAQLLRQYNGDMKLALAAYNAGPANVDKYNDIPPFEETKNYVARVLGYLKYFEAEV